MRILQVSNYQPPHVGGIQMAAESLTRHWKAAGHQVTWLTTDIPRNARPSTPDNIRIAATGFLEQLCQLYVPLVGPRGRRRIPPLLDGQDVVIVHSLAPGVTTIALRAAMAAGKPLVVTQHIGVVPLPFRILERMQTRYLSRMARRTVAAGGRLTFVARMVQDWFVEAVGIPADRTCLTPTGIDHEQYSPVSQMERERLRQKWKIAGNPLNVLFVGRFTDQKGLPLIRAVARRTRHIHYTMVGTGPVDAQAWGLPNVSIFPFVEAAELRELYGAHDLFLLPTVGEGWPAVVCQAMACGLPCLISEETFQGHRQDPEKFFIRPRNEDVIAGTIEDAAAGRLPLMEHRDALSTYARQRWNWQTTAQIYLEVFRRAIEEHASAAPSGVVSPSSLR